MASTSTDVPLAVSATETSLRRKAYEDFYVPTKKPKVTALSDLIEAPKGHTDYKAGQAFALQVFWEAPHPAAAKELLAALEQCAVATHRDTPAVPTYFFRISSDSSSCHPTPRTIGDHPLISAALKKVQVGVPIPAVRADLVRQGFDPNYAEMPLTAELPVSDQGEPVAIECTEIYLDDRAFYQHSHSRDYLAAYGKVMKPSLHLFPATTLRFGTPTVGVVEKILQPILREVPTDPSPTSFVFHRPAPAAEGGAQAAVLLSLDVPTPKFGTGESISAGFQAQCSTFLAFLHPLHKDTTRILCVLPVFSSVPASDLKALAALEPIRGEAHLTGRPRSTKEGDDAAAAGASTKGASESVRAALVAAGLTQVTVNATESAGYALHDKAAELHPTSD